MKISGLSCITKKIFLVFLGHPTEEAPVENLDLFNDNGISKGGKWWA